MGTEGNRVQEISEISRGLKGVARELNVPSIWPYHNLVAQSKVAARKYHNLLI